MLESLEAAFKAAIDSDGGDFFSAIQIYGWCPEAEIRCTNGKKWGVILDPHVVKSL